LNHFAIGDCGTLCYTVLDWVASSGGPTPPPPGWAENKDFPFCNSSIISVGLRTLHPINITYYEVALTRNGRLPAVSACDGRRSRRVSNSRSLITLLRQIFHNAPLVPSLTQHTTSISLAQSPTMFPSSRRIEMIAVLSTANALQTLCQPKQDSLTSLSCDHSTARPSLAGHPWDHNRHITTPGKIPSCYVLMDSIHNISTTALSSSPPAPAQAHNSRTRAVATAPRTPHRRTLPNTWAHLPKLPDHHNRVSPFCHCRPPRQSRTYSDHATPFKRNARNNHPSPPLPNGCEAGRMLGCFPW